MTVVPTGFDIESRLAAMQAERDAQSAPGELGRDAFLKLLVGQLSHQDPMSPLQDQEFVAQLATFSSLEQLQNINDGIQASLLMNQSVNNSLATNLIGKEILASGGDVEVGESGDVPFRVDLAQAADVKVEIVDSEGNVVRTLDKTGLAGSNDFEWDGENNAGDRVPSGSYTIRVSAKDESDATVASAVSVRARVDGVRFHEGTGYLLVNGNEIPLASVVEVLAPSGS